MDVVVGESSAAAVSSIDAAARTDTNLMRTMVAVMWWVSSRWHE
jgi:hypothetical protein